MRPRRIPPNEQIVNTVVRGPNPVTVWRVGAQDLVYSWALSGRTNGVIRAGEPSDRSRKYSGDLGALQNFRGAASLGHTGPGSIRPGFNTALPNTHGPVAGRTNPVMSIMAGGTSQ